MLFRNKSANWREKYTPTSCINLFGFKSGIFKTRIPSLLVFSDHFFPPFLMQSNVEGSLGVIHVVDADESNTR